jgi:hypothetical protein
MTNNSQTIYSAIGIPEEMIKICKGLMNRVIISISNLPSAKLLNSERRGKNAEKVWDRLVPNNLATYDPKNDIYTLN